MKKSHRWKLVIESSAQRTFNKLPSGKDRMAVFDLLQRLLEADDPYRVPGVQKILSGPFQGMRRQRQGDWRIIFYTLSGQIGPYKGELHFYDLRRRSEDTYD